jgi:serine/threonine-protein kinase
MRELDVGDTVDRYALTELLARGGMASVFKAVEKDKGATVVLKVPHLHVESDLAFYERFGREEAIGQRLEHPSIVKVHEVPEKSRRYMVMDYAPGKPLRSLFGPGKPLDVERALSIARKLCEALVYMHDMGVVHRDLKPDNILVQDDGGIKILDFGIALDAGARRMTWFGLSKLMGTPDYMAPEQVRGKRGDARTDVYAVGTILYEMLTGTLPFETANLQSFIRAKVNEDPDAVGVHEPETPPQLEAIVMRAIARAPRDRHARADDLLKDLRDPSSVAVADSPSPRRGRSLWLYVPRRVVAGVALSLVLSGLFFLVWLSSHRPPVSGARRGQVQVTSPR